MTPEERAWNRLQQPVSRGVYEHVGAWRKRERRRVNFVRRINRDPGGCWTWIGQKARRAGNPYPAVTFRNQGKRTQRSAFVWMTEEFFPEISLPHRTSITCNNSMCVNLYHRANGMVTNNVLTASQALEVYQAKGNCRSQDVAERFGISQNQVMAIWRGRNWSAVTGQERSTTPTRPRAIPAQVAEQIRSVKGTMTGKQAAAEFGVSEKTVRRVWANVSRAGLRTKQDA